MRALDGIYEAGECPFWHDGRWIWVDNARGTILTSDGETTEAKNADAVCALPRADGGVLVISTTTIGDFIAPEGTRFNDGKCDGRGRLWVGTMSLTGQPGQGVLFRYDGQWNGMASGFDVCNGLGWSPDYRWMYFTDTVPRVIWRYAFDLKTGTLGERTLFHRFAPGIGKPDGLAVDAEGCVWSALWDGWCVVRLSSGGQIIDQIDMPVPRPTSLAFGDGQLLITSARKGLTDAQLAMSPKSGQTFLMHCPVAGMPVAAFKG